MIMDKQKKGIVLHYPFIFVSIKYFKKIQKKYKKLLTNVKKYGIIYTESEVNEMRKRKIKEFFEIINFAADEIEKLSIKVISIVGWIIILIHLFG